MWSVLHFYVPDGSRFLKCNKNSTDVSFGVFIINKKNPLFHPFVLFFLQCVLGLSGLLGLNAVINLPFNCNAIIVWSLEMFVVRQAFINMS